MRRGRPLRRTSLIPRSSALAIADAARERTVRDEVFARDGYRCVLADHIESAWFPRCSGPLTFHHRRKASAGGSYTVQNGVSACLTHNLWVEEAPVDARTVLGGFLVVREGDPEWESLGRRAARKG